LIYWMKLIVGLGNPGKEYEYTRHNTGFLVVESFLAEQKVNWEKKFDSLFCRVTTDGMETIFLKPQTFMNESGRAVMAAVNFYKIDTEHDLLVIHDDVDLPLGTVKLADDSSSAGHKGVQNIIDALNSQKFHRVRIGINQRESSDPTPTEAYVLQDFSETEREALGPILTTKLVETIQDFLKN
jgi:PTH1 family peptidyl-tRNA hydrolase